MAFSVATLADHLAAALNGGTLGNLTAATEAQLYQSFNRALERIGSLALLASSDAALTVAANTPTQALPARSAAVIYAASRLGSDPWYAMEHWSRSKLEAFDPTHADRTSDDAPAAYMLDMEAGLLRVYPSPSSNAGLTLVTATRPAAVAVAGNVTVTAPDILADHLYLSALRDARGANGSEAMPDAAAAAGELLDGLEAALASYWA
jgi:hypothetical protein